MIKQLWNRVGKQATHVVASGQLRGSRLNMKLGFALMRDRRVSFWPKLFSLGLGAALAALLIALEIAPEGVLAALLPGIGLAFDFVTDGMEAVILPVLFGALLLPFLAPRQIVDEILMERSTSIAPPLPSNPTS